MADPPEPPEPSAEDELRRSALVLADAIEAVLPGWVERSVADIATAFGLAERAWSDATEAAAEAGQRARQELGASVRELLGTDLDEQRTTPLDVLRHGTRYATAVLQAAGVPPVVRDDFAERAFPDDLYGLSPATWADVDPVLAEPGLRWSAAKAMAHLRRHRGKP